MSETIGTIIDVPAPLIKKELVEGVVVPEKTVEEVGRNWREALGVIQQTSKIEALAPQKLGDPELQHVLNAITSRHLQLEPGITEASFDPQTNIYSFKRDGEAVPITGELKASAVFAYLDRIANSQDPALIPENKTQAKALGETLKQHTQVTIEGKPPMSFADWEKMPDKDSAKATFRLVGKEESAKAGTTAAPEAEPLSPEQALQQAKTEIMEMMKRRGATQPQLKALQQELDGESVANILLTKQSLEARQKEETEASAAQDENLITAGLRLLGLNRPNSLTDVKNIAGYGVAENKIRSDLAKCVTLAEKQQYLASIRSGMDLWDFIYSTVKALAETGEFTGKMAGEIAVEGTGAGQR